MKNLTISYITNRIDPRIEWFFSSLSIQGGNEIPVNVIDFHADSQDRRHEVAELAKRWNINLIQHQTPMPNVWQGKHRLTKDNYFAASTASNTAIALCPTEWIAFVDDLSVLRPHWLTCVKEATSRSEITCGSYMKVLELEVKKGEVTGYKFHQAGEDHRAKMVGWGRVVPCNGSWFFGCSFVAPVEYLLDINGFDTGCDSMGYQDTLAGMMLEARGKKFVYDSRMVTFESEELHGQPGNVFHRWDPGVSPNDKSHKMIDLIKTGRHRAPNEYGPPGLRGLRDHVLSGHPFPVIQIPEHEWFTGTPLKELPPGTEQITHAPFERNTSSVTATLRSKLARFQKFDGWCTVAKAEKLAQLVLDYQPKLIVELGVFGGRSIGAMAMACQNIGSGRCIGIDPWTVKASTEGNLEQVHLDWWGKIDHENVYQLCKSRLRQVGLGGVELWRETDETAITKFDDGTIDLLHSDSNHSEEVSVRVTQMWHPKIRKGGILVFDDILWSTQARAVEMIKKEMGYEILDEVINDQESYLVARKL